MKYPYYAYFFFFFFPFPIPFSPHLSCPLLKRSRRTGPSPATGSLDLRPPSSRSAAGCPCLALPATGRPCRSHIPRRQPPSRQPRPPAAVRLRPGREILAAGFFRGGVALPPPAARSRGLASFLLSSDLASPLHNKRAPGLLPPNFLFRSEWSLRHRSPPFHWHWSGAERRSTHLDLDWFPSPFC